MRILRIVNDYWPCVGGNERWNMQFDRWFTETAGDDVQVVVLRPEALYSLPGYREALQGFRFVGSFDIPDLLKVKAYQEVLPRLVGLRLARYYYHVISPWLEKGFDVITTQIGHFHTYFCWRGRPVALEPGSLTVCNDENIGSCVRAPLFCQHCFRKRGGIRWWIRDQLKRAWLSQFNVIVYAYEKNALKELRKVNMDSRAFRIRHIVDLSQMFKPLTDAKSLQNRAKIDAFADQYEYVLLLFNRLVDYHNQHLLLDIAEYLPEAGIVFAGDGPDRGSLERRVNASPSLRGRVLFIGAIPADSIGWFAQNISAFFLTSTKSNAGTSLIETMGLGIGPVIAVDTKDFHQEFLRENLILRVQDNAAQIANETRKLLSDRERCAAMVAAAKRYVETYHSPDQMWAYRDRLLQLAESYR